jgi:hypothetical protein
MCVVIAMGNILLEMSSMTSNDHLIYEESLSIRLVLVGVLFATFVLAMSGCKKERSSIGKGTFVAAPKTGVKEDTSPNNSTTQK